MKFIATRKSQQNETMVDPWTVVHFAAGLAVGLVRMPFGWGLGLALGYEVVEQILERKEVGQELFETAGPEAVPNAILDVAVFAAGHLLGEMWNETGQPETPELGKGDGEG